MEKKTPYRADNLIQHPLEQYLARFAKANCQEMSKRTGLSFENNRFFVTVLGESRTITWDAFEDDGWKDKERILFLRFLLEGKKPKAHTCFTTYRNLPWGDVYDRQFTARCIHRLAGTYGTRPAVYEAAAQKLGGKKIQSSGLAYEFCFMPGLYLQTILWEGDEDFPASAQILFSDNFPDAFSAEDRVIVCELLFSALKAAEDR